MKITFILIIIELFLINHFYIKAQNINGLYRNNYNEFLCIQNDTMIYCLKNYDDFATYSISIGKPNVKKNKIKSKSLFFENTTADFYESQRNDSLIQLVLLDKNNIPIDFAIVMFKTKIQGKLKKIYIVSDEYGIVNLSFVTFKVWVGLPISIVVNSLDFSTEQKTILQIGKNYLIKSRIPSYIPFIIVNKPKETIKYIMKDSILSIWDSNNKRIVDLKKASDCKSCKEILFNAK